MSRADPLLYGETYAQPVRSRLARRLVRVLLPVLAQIAMAFAAERLSRAGGSNQLGKPPRTMQDAVGAHLEWDASYESA